MFLERTNTGKRMGWVEVICGSMFSGKTEELIRRLIRAKIAKQKVVVFKPGIDNRYSEHHIVSHDISKMPCMTIDSSDEIIPNIGEASVIGVDEAQFFDDNIIHVVNQMADMGKRVILAGCEMYSG